MLNSPLLAPWPHYEADEIEAASKTLMNGQVNYWTGSLGKRFEQTYAESVGKAYGIALSNGTVALELALRAFNIGPGDEVIVASRSYVASASCVSIVGAIPVFADIELESGNISAETIAPLITSKTKAVIPVHIGGLPCDMPAIMDLARQHNIKVIEDCAQAHGASIENTPVGGWGDAAIFSFCQDKIISTGGEGGMLVLDDESSYKTAWAFKDIGRNYDAVHHQKHPPGFRWLTHSVGSNFRLTEFQSAIGLKQLQKLDSWVSKRNSIATQIAETVKPFAFLQSPFIKSKNITHAYYRFYMLVKHELLSTEENHALRDQIIEALNNANVPCFSGSCSEIYLEQAFSNIYSGARLSNAKFYSERAFCLLCHPTITDDQLELMLNLIANVLNIIELSINE